MSQASRKITSSAVKPIKNKHGVKFLGLKEGSPAFPRDTRSSAEEEPYDVLEGVHPLKHQSALPKKKFKSSTRKRYRSSLMKEATAVASGVAPVEETVDVDEIIKAMSTTSLKKHSKRFLKLMSHQMLKHRVLKKPSFQKPPMLMLV